MKSLFGIALLLTIVGCGTTKIHEYRAHSQDDAKPGEVSVLFVPRQILIYEIDGEGRYHPGYISAVAPYNGAKIELLPGEHEATIVYNNTVSATKRSQFVFKVAASRRYFIAPEVHRKDNREYISYTVHECGSDREKRINEGRKTSASMCQ